MLPGKHPQTNADVNMFIPPTTALTGRSTDVTGSEFSSGVNSSPVAGEHDMAFNGKRNGKLTNIPCIFFFFFKL